MENSADTALSGKSNATIPKAAFSCGGASGEELEGIVSYAVVKAFLKLGQGACSINLTRYRAVNTHQPGNPSAQTDSVHSEDK